MKHKHKLSQFGLAAVLALTMLMPGMSAGADTFQLGDNQWLNVDDSPDTEYVQAISKLKQQVSKGELNAVNDAILKMKSDFPEKTGPDFDGYMKAEVLYAEGKWAKAVDAYDVFLDSFPNSPLYESAIERQLSVATAYLNGEKRVVMKFLKLSAVEDAAAIIDRIVDNRVGNDSPIAQRALVLLATSYSRMERYLDARDRWYEVNSSFGTGRIGQEARLQMAYNSHAAYNGPRLDDRPLVTAKDDFINFMNNPHDLVDSRQVEGRLNTIEEQLAYKQYTIGDYYTRTEHPEASKMYYEYVIEKWPASSAAEMAQARLDSELVTIIPIEKPGQKPKKKSMFDGLGKTLFNVSNKFVDSWPKFENVLSKKPVGK